MEPAKFPYFCTQPNTLITVLATAQRVLIAYERERDFMSAPKAFVITEVPANTEITLNACHANEAQWLVLQQEPFGVYQYQYDDNSYFVFYGAEQIVDLQANDLVQLGEVYHCTNTYEAIVKYCAQYPSAAHTRSEVAEQLPTT